MAVDIEEQKVTPSEHKNLFIILSLFNVFVGFFLLLAKVPFFVLALPRRSITFMDVIESYIESSNYVCGGLLIVIGGVCWAQKNIAIGPVQRGVIIALTNVAVAFGILLVFIHSASIVTHQTYKNAFICLGDSLANTTAVDFEMKGIIYSKEVFCTYLCYLYLFDSAMIACGLVVIVFESMTAMMMY